MSQRRVQIVLLCEDRQQEVFTRYLLNNIGFSTINIRSLVCPKGSQSGEQFVRERYSTEVKAYRSKSSYLSIGLVVVIDADNKTVQERLKELDDALKADSQQLRQLNEAICILIPKRNVETWIHYLQGESVDEEAEYSKFSEESTCKPYVENWVNQYYLNLDEKTPLSLQVAREELQRIMQLLR
ncbi:hypothetical protein WA1_13165 [Scytonema hofmannii PCC 7110]|uniref:Uncharacterized protein n=1 Tax=Scytonema hofmannii PCC 7110 TaxID=128403 RepID=A0A139XEE6_9CYAN|nr:hypothetical protein [Scytonema hofmannii]KYC43046.1 hypothetical protein WA1_13165 [Scytonema hofmannii PCC 7110]